MDVNVIFPHVALHEEMASNSDPHALLREAQADGNLPPSYYDHPVTRECGTQGTFATAIYMDGTPFLKRDSVLAIVCVNLITSVRHPCGVIRKSTLCRCGCAGWCSLWPIMLALERPYAALAAGRFPDGPCRSVKFDPYAHLAGALLACRALCLPIKTDWNELGTTLGWPTWASANWPCAWCSAERDTLHLEDPNCNEHDFEFELTSYDDYDDACKQCEHPIVINYWELRLQIRAALGRVRGSKSRGRMLRVCFDALGLEVGDRFEPSEGMPDWATLYALTSLPPGGVRLMFWREANASRARHRNPLYNPRLGLTPQRMLGDTLHVLYLGIFQVILAYFMRALSASNVWEFPSTFSPALVLEHTLDAFK